MKKKIVEIDQDFQKKRVIAPIDFNPLLPTISYAFGKLFKAMLLKKIELKETFPNTPMAAYI